jgi:hypothetical protein
VSLCACICLAAIGVFSGALPLMMVIFSTLGLVNWDLALLDRDPINSTSWKTATLLEKKHYASLALALGPGLLAATIGRLVHFRIPFGGMLVLVILVLFSLNQLWSLLITAPRRT